MKLETFFEKFDQFADAPDAVAKIRELVLRLAFSGELTGKRPTDDGVPDGWESRTIESLSASISSGFACSRSHQVENGHVHLRTHNISTLGTLNFDLLVRIDPKMVDPQKASIRAGDILFNNTNSQELVGKTSLVDRDYELPPSWTWVRFGEIMDNRDGERIPVSKEERETKAKTYDYYGASGIIDKIDHYLFDKPLLLIGEDGANLINRSTPIAFIARGKYWVNNHAHVLDGISEDFLQFIELHINAINLEKYVTGSAQPKMNQAKMNSIPIALPPLAEQRRIVAKVEQLMALINQLETQLTASRATAARLLEALVAELITT
jgi:hypothetical protein